jgi:hypothetical protein
VRGERWFSYPRVATRVLDGGCPAGKPRECRTVTHATVETQKKDKYIGKQIEDEAIKTIYKYENKKTRYGRGTGIINKKY